MYEHHEGVALARHVLLALEEGGDELGRVRHQEVEVLVDGEYGHDGVAAHVVVLVVETGLDRGHERLEQLGLLQLAQEAQRRAANELVRVLQVASISHTHT